MITVEELKEVQEAAKLADNLKEAIQRFDHIQIQLSDIIAKVDIPAVISALDADTVSKLTAAKAKLATLKAGTVK